MADNRKQEAGLSCLQNLWDDLEVLRVDTAIKVSAEKERLLKLKNEQSEVDQDN